MNYEPEKMSPDEGDLPCDAAGCPEPTSPARRRWLGWFGAISALLASLAAGLPIVGYLLSPVLRPRKDLWLDLGPVSDFPAGVTQLVKVEDPVHQPWDGKSAQMAAYVRHSQAGEFQVFAANCTHLGCPVTWFPQSGLFLCPCHGGVYYENGERASGPPPRGLYQLVHQMKDGHLLAKVGHLPTLQDPA